MSNVSQWIITVSTVSVVSGLLLCVMPRSKLKKTYSTLVGVLMIYAVMLPIIKSNEIKFDIEAIFDSSDRVSEQFSEKSDSIVIRSAELGVENAIGQLLNESGINYSRIESECEFDGGEITAKSVTVYTNESASKEKIEGIVKRSVGSETTVIIEGEKDEQA